MNYRGKKSYKEKGITLVALVVTIIVLLILAGITISLVLGQNGIINKATESRETQKVATIKEEFALALSAVEVDYHSNEETDTLRNYIFSLAPGKGQEKLKNELGPDNLSFDTANYKITYKDIEFSIDDLGKIAQNGSSGGSNPGELDWNQIKQSATKPQEQETTGDIGIDALGNVVNLDLWVYEKSTYLCPDTYEEIDIVMLGDYFGSEGGTVCYVPLQEDNLNNSKYNNVEKENIVCPRFIKFAGDSDFSEVNAMASDVFRNCTTIKSIILPDNLITIGHTAFYNCTSLSSINLPETLQYLDNNDGSGGSYTFENSGLTYLKIPSSVIFKGYGLVEDCAQLTRLDIDSQQFVNQILNSQFEIYDGSTYTNLTIGIKASYLPNNKPNILGPLCSSAYCYYDYSTESGGYAIYVPHQHSLDEYGYCSGCQQYF